ncbi:hypothetical protein AAMO2058_001350100 [Amorphochlora amoebiformis]
MGTCAGCVAHTQRPDTRVLKSRARAGDTWAARELALMYRFGYYQRIPSRKALRKAFHWFCQAAWDADRDAQYWLADCYDNGIGVEVDRRLATSWYTAAAMQGDARAIRRLSELQTCPYNTPPPLMAPVNRCRRSPNLPNHLISSAHFCRNHRNLADVSKHRMRYVQRQAHTPSIDAPGASRGREGVENDNINQNESESGSQRFDGIESDQSSRHTSRHTSRQTSRHTSRHTSRYSTTRPSISSLSTTEDQAVGSTVSGLLRIADMVIVTDIVTDVVTDKPVVTDPSLVCPNHSGTRVENDVDSGRCSYVRCLGS